ncbi:GatB_Yqey domain-containing protein/GatB_N domain-containing protein [Cephalotus follicularis]|uniref:GatB_Yqey domain-containing protein/GatB_N domain-containing protein n=1 Tax=Cephalotus follicularis TaxID=3775 RepID=A0A1Q3B2T5_CEPFO|nr:GatB_Yqey domain-containing protein/GatB_N domain-containing protein [Cephalotus follicularis]
MYQLQCAGTLIWTFLWSLVVGIGYEVDLNRAGVPLLEIVSEPNMRTGVEAPEYAAEVQRMVQYLGVSNGNMQQGSLRCDVNVSIRPVGQLEFGTKILFELMAKGGTVKGLIEEKDLVQIVDPAEIEKIVDKVLLENPKQLEQYHGGKTKLQGYFVGQVMKVSKGRANPGLLNKIVMEKLNATG